MLLRKQQVLSLNFSRSRKLKYFFQSVFSRALTNSCSFENLTIVS
ncbi:hypothetical protein Nmel_010616 [Mimus melanotis]